MSNKPPAQCFAGLYEIPNYLTPTQGIYLHLPQPYKMAQWYKISVIFVIIAPDISSRRSLDEKFAFEIFGQTSRIEPFGCMSTAPKNNVYFSLNYMSLTRIIRSYYNVMLT